MKRFTMQISAPSAGAAAYRTAMNTYRTRNVIEVRAELETNKKSIYRSSELAVQRHLVAVG